MSAGDEDDDFDPQEEDQRSLKRDIDPKRYQDARTSCIAENLAEGTQEFNTCIEKKLGLKTCSTSKRGRCINYTKDNPSYEELDMYDKMNFAVYMMDYNVQDKKEFAEGLSSTKQGFQGTASFMMIARPQTLISLLTFIDFMLIVIMILILIAMYIIDLVLSMFGVKVISPIKKSVMLWMIFALVLIYLLIFIIEYVYNKVQNRIEIINYNIK